MLYSTYNPFENLMVTPGTPTFGVLYSWLSKFLSNFLRCILKKKEVYRFARYLYITHANFRRTVENYWCNHLETSAPFYILTT